MSIKDLKTHNGIKVIWLDEVDSTNIYAKSKALEGETCAVVAGRQTAGKGRFNRVWENNGQDCLMMSMVLRPNIEISQTPKITCGVALSVVSAIKKVCKVATQIKWPNDVYCNNKKVCGISTEMTSTGSKVDFIISGIGINVNQKEFSEGLKNKAISLRLATGKEYDCEALFKCVIEEVHSYIKKLEDGISYFDEYTKLSAVINKNVEIKQGENTFFGVCLGFDENMEIIIGCDGVINKYNAGEISICMQD